MSVRCWDKDQAMVMSDGDTKVSEKLTNRDVGEKIPISAGSVEDYMWIFEEVIRNGELGFAVYYDVDDRFKFEPDCEGNFQPETRPLWLLAEFPSDTFFVDSFVDVKGLFELVREYVHDHVELPSETLYDVVTAWIFASYLLEKARAVPYLVLVGPPNSGKSRLLEFLTQLCYRAIFTPNFSNSTLFRIIQSYHPTLCLDESEVLSREQKAEIIGVLNAGYRKGCYVLRTNPETLKVDVFDPFGFKALASTQIFLPTLESRGIIINMRKNAREVPIFLDEKKAANLRLSLLIWRCTVLKEKIKILEDEKTILTYLPTSNGRIAELFYPLIALSPSDKIRQNISQFAQDVYGKRLEEEKAGIEADIVKAVLDAQDRCEGNKLSVEVITDKLNEGKPERQQWNPRSVGRQLKRLGFNSTRMTGGSRAIFLDQEQLTYLANRYTPKSTSLTSLMSLSPAMEHDGKSDVGVKSDVSSEKGSLALADLTSVYWKEESLIQKECGVCGYLKPTVWEGVTTKSQVVALCEDCVQEYQKARG